MIMEKGKEISPFSALVELPLEKKKNVVDEGEDDFLRISVLLSSLAHGASLLDINSNLYIYFCYFLFYLFYLDLEISPQVILL
jgi:hypothetical protein